MAVFPPPHKFFFARENEVNLGFVYYRKDDDHSSLWALRAGKRRRYHPWGVERRGVEAKRRRLRAEWDNYALYNAPAGTMQRMAVYYYLSTKSAVPTQEAVLAYTHDDVFKPLPGFKVMAGHFHMDFNEQLRDLGTMDYQPPWVGVFRALGINILYLGDFHDDSHPNDPGQSVSRNRRSTLRALSAISDKRFFGHARGRAERVFRRPLVANDA